MSWHLDYITPSTRLIRAAKENNVRELYLLRTKEPYLFLGYFWSWEENPLHVACKYGSLQFVKEFIKVSPKLARRRCQNGYSPLHLASENGHIEIVQALAEFDRGLCLEKDLNSNIPLHIAAMEGKDNVVRALVFAYPKTLQEVTSRGETALHLALKNRHCVTFKVLMEEIKKFKFQELLNRKDDEGNTILHIAASEKLVEQCINCIAGAIDIYDEYKEKSTAQILELLLSRNSATGIVVDVNSVNGRGYTALDAHYETSNDTVAKKIRRILVEAGGKEGKFLQNNIGHGQELRFALSESNISIAVFIMIATLTFTAACSPPNFFENEKPQKNAPLSILDMLFHRGSGNGTNFFYFMVFNVAGFMISMGGILVLTWPLVVGNVLILASAAVGIVFMILVERSMPHFNVIVGSFQISLAMCVWFSALAMCVWVSALAFTGCGVKIVHLMSRFLAAFTNGARRRTGLL